MSVTDYVDWLGLSDRDIMILMICGVAGVLIVAAAAILMARYDVWEIEGPQYFMYESCDFRHLVCFRAAFDRFTSGLDHDDIYDKQGIRHELKARIDACAASYSKTVDWDEFGKHLISQKLMTKKHHVKFKNVESVAGELVSFAKCVDFSKLKSVLQ